MDEKHPKIGRYQIEDSLGRGGMGVVYRAWDPELSRRVAIKVLLPELSSERALRRRFVREAQNLARLSHPNLVAIYDVESKGPQPFFVQELLVGRDLDTLLEEKLRLSPSESRRLALDLAGALSCLHENQIVHRDIKPSNVFLDESGRARLLDFGLALNLDRTRMTAHDEFLGTPVFASPEMLRGDILGPPSDVFQLGLLLHLCLTEELPDRNPDDLSVDLPRVARLDVPTPPLRDDLPPELRELIARCCQKKVEERFAHGAELLARLEGRSCPTPSQAHPPAPPHASRPGDGGDGGDSLVPLGKANRFRPLQVALLLLLPPLLLLAYLLRPESAIERERKGHPATAAFREGDLRLTLFPDGFHASLPKRSARPFRWELRRGTELLGRGTFRDERDRWWAESIGTPLKGSLKLVLLEEIRPVLERTIVLPSSPFAHPLRIRSGHGWIRWTWALHGEGEAELFLEEPENQAFRSLGFARTERRITGLNPRDKSTNRGYRLVLGKRNLAVGRIPLGIRNFWTPPSHIHGQPSILGVKATDEGLNVFYYDGPLVSLQPVESPGGIRAETAWWFDLRPLLGHRIRQGASAFLPSKPGTLRVLAGESDCHLLQLSLGRRRSIWKAREEAILRGEFSLAEAISTTAKTLDSEEGESFIPVRKGVRELREVRTDDGSYVAIDGRSGRVLLVKAQEDGRIDFRSVDLQAKYLLDALLLAPGRLALSTERAGHHLVHVLSTKDARVEWSHELPGRPFGPGDQGMDEAVSIGLLPKDGSFIAIREDRLYRFRPDHRSGQEPEVLALPLPKTQLPSQLCLLPNGRLTFFSLHSKLRTVQDILTITFQVFAVEAMGEGPLRLHAAPPQSLPNADRLTSASSLLFHQGQLFAVARAHFLELDPAFPHRIRHRGYGWTRLYGLHVFQDQLLSCKRNGSLTGLDLPLNGAPSP